MYTRKNNGRGRYGRARTRKSIQRGGARDEETSPFSLEGLREAIIGKPEEETSVEEVTDEMLFEGSPKEKKATNEETEGEVEEEKEDAVEEDVTKRGEGAADEEETGGEVADEKEETVEKEEEEEEGEEEATE